MTQNGTEITSLIFIDSAVEDKNLLIDALVSQHLVICLTPDKNGIQQIIEAQTQYKCSNIAIVAHGAPGEIKLGNSILSLDTFPQYESVLQGLFGQDTIGTSIRLYACNTAVGDAGTEFLEKLHISTEADIWASSSPIGHEQLGGNWELDVTTSISDKGINLFDLSLSKEWAHTLIIVDPNTDTDGDGVFDTVDVDDDNDGILDVDEGFVEAPNLLPDGDFDQTDVTPGNNINTGVTVDGNGFAVATVDSSQRFSRDVSFNNFGDNGTVDWSEGQYTTFSNTASSVTSWDGAQIKQAPAGGGFGIFSFNRESVFENLTGLVDGETYTVKAQVGVLPVYNTFRNGNPSFVPSNFTFGVSGTGDDTTLNGNALNGGNGYALSDFLTNLEVHDATPANPVTLDPYWEEISFTFTYDASTASGPRLFFQTSGGVVVVVDRLTLKETEDLARDSDADGIYDHLDLDSDNDGIPDNIEAQSTETYIAPSGAGAGITDVNGDGLDDVYDAGVIAGGSPTSVGLNPVNTDGTDEVDYLDTDSDNDGTFDIDESGLGLTGDVNGQTTGTVGNNGLDSAAETSDNYNDVNGLAHDNTNFTLLDTDSDTTANGSNASPTTADFDYRDDLQDHDNDGVPDTIDLDDDNDGILDTDEVPADPNLDTDNDGILDFLDPDTPGFVDSNNDGLDDAYDTDLDGNPDHQDIDADNDGITDLTESGQDPTVVDTDNDGVLDVMSNPTIGDTDNDGLADIVDGDNGGTPVTPISTDSDGLADFQDIDADNDGIPDNVESQPTTTYVAPSGTDTDSDGLDDAYDADSGGTPVTPENTDGIDDPDYLDSDSDNDGLDDILENGIPGNAPSGIDTDGDGLDDAFEGSNLNDADVNDEIDTPSTDLPDTDSNIGIGIDVDYREALDSDGDGVPDPLDLDDDNDGILDLDEVPADPNLDTDSDGIPNLFDPDAPGFVDANNDGTDDRFDTDLDGTPDHLDIDADNDGITDLIESGQDPTVVDTDGNGTLDEMDVPTTGDTDNDGLADSVDNVDSGSGPGEVITGTPVTPVNSDTDLLADFQDIDADNDGITDIVEGQPTGSYTAPIGTDSDGDGLDDAFDADNGGTPITPENTDGVDDPDYLDSDSDNDGYTDVAENGDPDIATGTDADGDGLDDAFDDVVGADPTDGVTDPAVDLPDTDGDFVAGGDVDYRDLLDTDGDGIGDGVDLDDDNDGILDTDEGPADPNLDTDGDGTPDFLDSDAPGFVDANNDGINDAFDTDGDGIPNHQDLDSDNDGISDLTESGQPPSVDSNNDGVLDSTTDVDQDGLMDAVDANDNDPTAGGTVTPVDTDQDGIANTIDLDSDDDGIPDIVEAQPTTGYIGSTDGDVTDQDADGDGIIDIFDSNDGTTQDFGGSFSVPNVDANDTADTLPDYLDTDSDGDGVDDIIESGLTPGVDNNGDGIGDNINASYADPDGDVNTPLTDLTNVDSDASDADYRSPNNPPAAKNDATTIPENTAARNINLTRNDTDPDASDDLEILSINTSNTLGTVSINPSDDTVVYSPNGQFDYLAVGETATDTFTYIVTDGNGGTDPAKVTVTIVGQNDQPTANDDATTIPENAARNINLTGNDTDPDTSDDLEILAIDTSNTLGTVSINPSDDTVAYNPNGQFDYLAAGETATDTFTYTVTDENGGTDTATVTVTIAGQNDRPTANDDALTIPESTAARNINLTGNDTDPDTSDDLEILSIDTSNTLGTVSINPSDDTVAYRPNGQFDYLAAGETATDTFTYTVTDGNGGTDTATVTVTIIGQNNFTGLGTQRPDRIVGTDAGDVISGFSDEDTLFGGAGNDTITGGSSSDTIEGGIGNDILSGGTNDDFVTGDDGNDTLLGGSGSDTLDGGRGSDNLIGSSGEDLLIGGLSTDVLSGGNGSDTLIGGVGADTLRGGQGRDYFAFGATSEFGDVITDFAIVEDVIDVSDLFQGSGSFSQNIRLIQSGNHTTVQARTSGSFETVGLLLNVNANTIDADNFKF